MSIEWIVGLRVKITTLLDNSITGKIYTYDAKSNTVTLEETALGSKPAGYRIIKTSFIRDVQVLDKPKKTQANEPGSRVAVVEKTEPVIGYVNTANMAKKEATAIQTAVKIRSTRGVGVSKEAQIIFDAIYKTIPCRWYNNSIIVMDEVRVDPPYTAESCKADTPGNALELVRRIITGTREKLNLEVQGG